ncbi:tRNA lysidine(34) synthetase TilS [Terricaulis sp.]|uniref:tRNA lysidine(34) synthetase TilS n=1 Tax=Terricaulis sp. TaxID=2768686 RepID=UPI00378393DF
MLDRATIERIKGPVVIALSGGGDSVALLHLLAAECGPARLRALVVDHALRHGSAADAGRAAGFAAALGVRAEILTLDWPAGRPRAQQAAREARYRALCDATRGMDAGAICVAHTADDQAETVFMRAAGGSAWRGLASMPPVAPAPVWPQGRGVVLVRPLLDVRRIVLRDFLRARGAEWIDDPANSNEAFERVRARARLAALERAGFDPLRLARLARRLRARAEALDREALELIARAARFDGARIALAPTKWSGALETRRRSLSVLVTAASGSAREPQLAAVERLEARLGQESFRGAALGGARLRRRGVEVWIERDPGALLGRADGTPGVAALALAAGAETVWDGRLALHALAPGWRIEAEADGPVIVKGDQRIVAAEMDRAGFQPIWLLELRVRALLHAS